MLGRLGVAGVEPLACALGISVSTTYDHLARLERARLAWRYPYRDGEGGIVGISRKGAARVRDEDLPAVFAKSHIATTGVHARAVSWVAAYFEIRDDHFWLGPAELHQDDAWRGRRDDGAGHYPDLGVERADGSRIAIEVELHAKSNDRLRAILTGYRRHLDQGKLARVAYITSRPAVARAVQRQAEHVLLVRRIEFATLDQVIDATRARTAKARKAKEKP